jgi:hypothetical protein
VQVAAVGTAIPLEDRRLLCLVQLLHARQQLLLLRCRLLLLLHLLVPLLQLVLRVLLLQQLLLLLEVAYTPAGATPVKRSATCRCCCCGHCCRRCMLLLCIPKLNSICLHDTHIQSRSRSALERTPKQAAMQTNTTLHTPALPSARLTCSCSEPSIKQDTLAAA